MSILNPAAMSPVLSEIGRSSRVYCEQAYRTEPVGADVVMALVDMGISLEGLQVGGRAETSVKLMGWMGRGHENCSG